MTGIGLTSPLAGLSTDLTQVPAAGTKGEAQKIAQDFEGLFMSMLVKEMRQTSEGEGLFPGDSSDTYGGMFDMFMGQHMAEQGGVGLAKSLQPIIAAQIARQQTEN